MIRSLEVVKIEKLENDVRLSSMNRNAIRYQLISIFLMSFIIQLWHSELYSELATAFAMTQKSYEKAEIYYNDQAATAY